MSFLQKKEDWAIEDKLLQAGREACGKYGQHDLLNVTDCEKQNRIVIKTSNTDYMM